MREIKFRGWYGERIGMLEPSFNGMINEIFAEKNGDYMQYTGLKDAQGIEVYEGDIYERELHLIMYGTDLNELCTERYVVTWNNDYGGYYFGETPVYIVLNESHDHATLCRVTKLPVRIGNIHENPELLEGR